MGIMETKMETTVKGLSLGTLLVQIRNNFVLPKLRYHNYWYRSHKKTLIGHVEFRCTVFYWPLRVLCLLRRVSLGCSTCGTTSHTWSTLILN